MLQRRRFALLGEGGGVKPTTDINWGLLTGLWADKGLQLNTLRCYETTSKLYKVFYFMLIQTR